MNFIAEHLCVPMGLVIDNSRDYVMLKNDALDNEEINQLFDVTHDDTMDYFYETMLLHKNKFKKSINKTRKKKRA